MKTTSTQLLKSPHALQIIAAMVIGLGVTMTGHGQTHTMNFSTGSADGWSASGGGAVNSTPYVVSAPGWAYPVLSVTSTGRGDGTFIEGGSHGNFDGFWTASYNFYLPANATGTSFQYANLFADDRLVLKMNGTILNATGVPWTGYPGSMVMTQGGPLQPYSPFHLPNGSATDTVTSGFVLGGMNTIDVIVNNTGTGIYGNIVDLTNPGYTDFGMSGTISYVVPEPSAIAVFGLGLIGLACGLRRRA